MNARLFEIRPHSRPSDTVSRITLVWSPSSDPWTSTDGRIARGPSVATYDNVLRRVSLLVFRSSSITVSNGLNLIDFG